MMRLESRKKNHVWMFLMFYCGRHQHDEAGWRVGRRIMYGCFSCFTVDVISMMRQAGE